MLEKLELALTKELPKLMHTIDPPKAVRYCFVVNAQPAPLTQTRREGQHEQPI